MCLDQEIVQRIEISIQIQRHCSLLIKCNSNINEINSLIDLGFRCAICVVFLYSFLPTQQISVNGVINCGVLCQILYSHASVKTVPFGEKVQQSHLYCFSHCKVCIRYWISGDTEIDVRISSCANLRYGAKLIFSFKWKSLVCYIMEYFSKAKYIVLFAFMQAQEKLHYSYIIRELNPVIVFQKNVYVKNSCQFGLCKTFQKLLCRRQDRVWAPVLWAQIRLYLCKRFI